MQSSVSRLVNPSIAALSSGMNWSRMNVYAPREVSMYKLPYITASELFQEYPEGPWTSMRVATFSISLENSAGFSSPGNLNRPGLQHGPKAMPDTARQFSVDRRGLEPRAFPLLQIVAL